MFRFGLKNIRRLKNVSPIELRPITILVGRNSSGKSTFLRTFPLMRQSLMTKTSSPILWYGDLVDFGDYSSVVTDANKNEKISFLFGVGKVETIGGGYRSASGFIYKAPKLFYDVNIEISIILDDKRTRLDSFFINYNENCNFLISIDKDGNASDVVFNNVSIISFFNEVVFSIDVDTLFPSIYISPKDGKSSGYYNQFDWSIKILKRTIKNHANNRIGDVSFKKFADQFFNMTNFNDVQLSLLEKNTSVSSFKNIISDVRGTNDLKLKDNLKSIYEAARLFLLMPAFFRSLQSKLSSTLYIGPMRARSERYYRYQDLAVSEIDPDGKNFPMFLNALTFEQRKDFSEWIHSLFGYRVEISQEVGHISINLMIGQHTTNIVDTGYGISQALPVLGQIWWASRGGPQKNKRYSSGRPTKEGSILVIEQPELHLHPAHQALIADAIVGARNTADSGDTGLNLQYIIETHSEALINRLGDLIAEEKVKAEDVQVLIFESDDADDERATQVRIARFDSEGALQNWPYGFFQPVI